MSGQRTRQSRTSAVPPGTEVLWCTYALALVLAVSALLLRAVRSPTPPRVGAPAAGAATHPPLRIDPNLGDWAELAALPDIGEVIARRIVAYRESLPAAGRPVFRQPDDLLAVKGIGRKTVARIAPFLRFGEAPASATGP